MINPLPETGERMIPETTYSEVFWEHVYRYAFACQKVKNLNVLDIASGEGYGSYALSKVAKSVVGVDICSEVVEHAKKKYKLDYRVGSAESIPADSASFDAVVSFETIEHVPAPEAFIVEVFRVLKPGGIFIVSTPNKDVYHHGMEPNPFHCSEMTKDEFLTLLSPYFQVEKFFGQMFPSDTKLGNDQQNTGKLSNSLAYGLRRMIQEPMRRRFLPFIDMADATVRQQIIDSIPKLSPPLNSLWNPYSLRQLDTSVKEQPKYFIAVFTRRDDRV